MQKERSHTSFRGTFGVVEEGRKVYAGGVRGADAGRFAGEIELCKQSF